MKNKDLLKKKICKQIEEMSSEELYFYVLQPEPFLSGLCKLCEAKWGECPETNEDAICISRFKAWCEQVNDQEKLLEQMTE